MNSKNHRQNHNFQILHFLAGSCHTADGAYALLQDLKEEREGAIDAYNVFTIREKAREITAKKMVDNIDELTALEGQAQLLEISNSRKTEEILLAAAISELSFINDCMDRLEPMRKYSDMTIPEATEECQKEEWCLELMRRAENSLLTTGTIPTDQFATMRMHPDFKTIINPHIENVQIAIAQKDFNKLSEILEKNELNLPLLLELK